MHNKILIFDRYIDFFLFIEIGGVLEGHVAQCTCYLKNKQ